MEFSPKQAQTIRMPFHTFEVNEGTPRSGKTTAGIFRYAANLIKSRDQNHLVIAYNQEQAYKLVMEGDGLGLLHIFSGASWLKHDDNGDHLEIQTPNGIKRVYYKGGGKADSHKAITGMSLGSIYFCEIDLLHQNLIQECFRRTFAAKDRFHIADLNPPPPMHPVLEIFDTQGAYWQHWTINDNPIITPDRRQEIYNTLVKSPYLFKRDWLGERTTPIGVIYSMFDHKRHIVSRLEGEPIEMYFSGDGGQGDATSVSCNIVCSCPDGFRLYRVANYYHSGRDTGIVKAMSVYAREIAAFVDWCVRKYNMPYTGIWIDPACKSLREELNLIGYPASPADNNGKEKVGGQRGIEVGIERTQNAISDGRFYLLDTDQYGHADFLREIGLYCRDEHGKPVDMYNHAMDELRYSINYFYKSYIG